MTFVNDAILGWLVANAFITKAQLGKVKGAAKAGDPFLTVSDRVYRDAREIFQWGIDEILFVINRLRPNQCYKTGPNTVVAGSTYYYFRALKILDNCDAYVHFYCWETCDGFFVHLDSLHDV